jgi:hypothetical protein
MTPEKLALLEKALTMDLAEIPLHLRFRVNVTDVDETFEMQRQNLMTLVQIMSMYFEKMIQLGQAMDSGTLGPISKTIAASALETATAQMIETLKLFGKEETLGSLPDSRKLAFLREMGEAMLGQMLQGAAGAMGGTIYLHEPSTRRLKFKHVLPSDIGSKLERLDIPDNFGVAGEVFQARTARINEFPNASVQTRTDFERKAGVTVRSMLTMPLMELSVPLPVL